MDINSNQIVLNENDGCNWLFESTPEMEQENYALSMLNIAEQNAKQRIDQELTTLRDKLQVIVLEQRNSAACILGVNTTNTMQEQTDEAMVPYVETCESNYEYHEEQQEEEEHYQQYGGENGIADLGSNVVQYDVDISSGQSMHSSQKTREQVKNEYLLRILTATMKISNALKKMNAK